MTPMKANVSELKEKLKAAGNLEEEKIEEASAQTRSSTGFVVGNYKDGLLIVTCCHNFQDCYSIKEKMTTDDVENFFHVRVLCDHYDDAIDNENMVLRSSNALVLHINTQKDILLLHALFKGIKNKKRVRCLSDHSILSLGTHVEETNSVFMLSWPPNLHLSCSGGTVSCASRVYSAVGAMTAYGYDMRLCEVNMSVVDGSSGAPLLDKDGKVLGLLHASGNNCIYFVELRTLRKVLEEWMQKLSTT